MPLTYTGWDLRSRRQVEVGCRGWRVRGESAVRVVNSRDRELLTLAEAAAYLRVHRRTMSRLLRQGVVPGTKIGRQWRVRKVDLDAVLTTGMPQASGSDGLAETAAKPERSSRNH